MTDPKQQANAQLKSIESLTGQDLDHFTGAVEAKGLERHGDMLRFFKTEYGLTHGHANLLALKVREKLAGGPASADSLLAAQYAGAKSALRPICDEILATAAGLGDDVEVLIQKTGVSLRRRKQFGLVQVPSAKRVTLGLSLKHAADDARLLPASGMCTHKINLTDPGAVDDDVARWLHDAYMEAG
ncbi:DUF4287 domain-containing protein [Nitratireductor sp. XY-223]|uniref:DUF4287 domain-containing protein n=1 Tax=Nitratireductor sp. XY-223 TaxID=2561926 RepID=UPI0010AB154F|nr:DUF4287 domain-containing protein [Nitratireductor sp. XY-223]